MKVFFATFLLLGSFSFVIAQDSPKNTLKPGEYNAYQDAIGLNAFLEIINKLKIDKHGVWVLQINSNATDTLEINKIEKATSLSNYYGIRILTSPDDVGSFNTLSKYNTLKNTMNSENLNQNIRMIVRKIISNYQFAITKMDTIKKQIDLLKTKTDKEIFNKITEIETESSILSSYITKNQDSVAKWESAFLDSSLPKEESKNYTDYKSQKEIYSAKIREFETQKLNIMQQLNNIIATLSILDGLEEQKGQLENNIFEAFKIFNSIKILHLDNGEASGILANGSFSATPIRMEDVTRQIGLPSEEEAVRALSEFIMTRAQDELINSFLQRLQSDLKTNIVLQGIFPATLKMMKAASGAQPLLSQNRVNSVWIAAVSEDMQHMPENILPTLDSLFPGISSYQEYNYLLAGIMTYKLANMGDHPAEIISTLAAQDKINGELGKILDFLNLFSKMFRRPASDSLPGYWLTPNEIKSSLLQEDALFIPLVIKYYKADLIRIFNLPDAISEDELLINIKKAQNLFMEVTRVFEKSELLIRNFKNQVQEGTRITPESYTQYLSSLTEILIRSEDIYFQIQKISFDSLNPELGKLIYERKIYTQLKRAEHIFQSLQNKDYGSVIVELVQILEDAMEQIKPNSFIGQLLESVPEKRHDNKYFVKLFSLALSEKPLLNNEDLENIRQYISRNDTLVFLYIDMAKRLSSQLNPEESMKKFLLNFVDSTKPRFSKEKSEEKSGVNPTQESNINLVNSYNSPNVNTLEKMIWQRTGELLSVLITDTNKTYKEIAKHSDYYLMQAFKSVTFTQSKSLNYLKTQKYLSKAMTVAGLFVDLLNSSTHKEIKQILHQYAAPLGTYSIKGRAHYALTITSIPGFTIGNEYNAESGVFNQYVTKHSGFFGPLGLQLTMALNPYRENWNPAFGLLVSPLDLGAAFSYPYNKTDSSGNVISKTSNAPQFKDIFMPGVFFTMNVDDKFPISLGLGIQYSNQLRDYTNGVSQIFRWSAYAGVDVTLLKIWATDAYRYMKPRTSASRSWLRNQGKWD